MPLRYPNPVAAVGGGPIEVWAMDFVARRSQTYDPLGHLMQERLNPGGRPVVDLTRRREAGDGVLLLGHARILRMANGTGEGRGGTRFTCRGSP